MVRQLTLFDLPPRSRSPCPATAAAVKPGASTPAARRDGRPAATAGESSGISYRCYAPLARGEQVEGTLSAALAAYRARLGSEPDHVAAHPDDLAALTAATHLRVVAQRTCPRGQVRLALP